MSIKSLARDVVRQPLAPLAFALALTLTTGGGYASHSIAAATTMNNTTASVTANAEGQSNYTVILREPALAVFAGNAESGRSAVPRTKSASGRERMDVQSTQALDYVAHLKSVQDDFLQSISGDLGRQIDVVQTYQHALNGLVLRLTAAEAEQIQRRGDVEMMEAERQLKLRTFDTPEFLGIPTVWNDTTAPNGTGYKGEGIVIGIIDSGINYLSNAFNAIGDDGYAVINPLGDANFLGRCQTGGANFGNCNNKLIGIYDTVSTSGANGRDINGHGTHTASTAAGGVVRNASYAGGPFNMAGIAPHANIISYKACCTSIGLDAAINQTVADGVVDVINYSIGGPNEGPWLNTSDLAFLNATNAGIFVAQAAGNDGPGESTTDSYAPWVMTVGAQTPRSLAGFGLTVAGYNGLAPMAPGGTPAPTQGFTDLPIIESPNFADGANDGCVAYPANHFRRPQTATGAQGIAVLHLDQNTSTCGSGARRTAAANAGAIAVVFVDPEYINLGASGASYSLQLSDWNAIKAVVGDVTGATGTATSSIGFPAQSVPRTPNILAGFSSRGPTPWGVLKPEVTAPGTNILAAISPTAATGYTVVANQAATRGLVGPNSGTSMASPHVAGAAALIRQARPDWTPMEVKSALMTTANSALSTSDGAAANPNQRGSGLINTANAIRAGLVLNETAANFRAADPAIGGNQALLNVASYYNVACVDRCVFPRTVRSTGRASRWTIAVTGLPAGSFTLDMTTLNLGETSQQSYSLTFNTSGLAIGQFYYGELTLTPADATIPTARMPIAIRSATANLRVDTQEITATVVANTNVERPVVISNRGNPTLNWSIPADTLRATLVSRKPNTSGSSNRTVVTAATTSAIESASTSNGYVFDWFDIAGGGTRLVSLQMSGFNNDAALSSFATQIAYRVYADDNGRPNGRPRSTVAGDQPPVFQWPAAAGGGPITAPGLTVGDDVTLNLPEAGVVSPALAAGRYWLNFAPSISGTTNNYFMLLSSIPGKTPVAQRTQPNGNATVSAYSAASTVNANTGLAMEVVVDAACGAPWLSTSSSSGNLGLNGSSTVQVRLNATGMAPGDYSAFLCVSGNGTSPNFYIDSLVGTRDAFLIPVKMTVTAAAVSLAATGLATPASAPAGGSSLLTVNVTPGTQPASTGINVNANLTAIGGSAAQAFRDDGSSGDVAANDGIWSYSATIAAATTAGAKSLPVTVVDAQSRQATTAIALDVQAANVSLSAIGSSSPASVLPGDSAALSVMVTSATNPVSTAVTVTADLTAIGGSATQAFTAGTGGQFSHTALVALATTAGTYSLSVTVRDAENRTATTTISIVVTSSSDVIFRNGFDSTTVTPPASVVTRTLNAAVYDSFNGSCINWLTGVVRDNIPSCPSDHFNPRKNNTNNLVFSWNDIANGGVANGTAYALLAAGAVIGPASSFITADTSLPSLAFRPAGGVDGYLGFRFMNTATSQTNYGYVRINNLAAVATSGMPATIVSYAYDSSGAAITIPAN